MIKKHPKVSVIILANNAIGYISDLIVFSGFSVGISAFYRTINRMKTSIVINSGHIILMALLIFISIRTFDPLMVVILSMVISTVLFLAVHLFMIRSIFKIGGLR